MKAYLFVIVFFVFVAHLFAQAPNVTNNQCISLKKPVYSSNVALNWSQEGYLSDGDDGTVFEVASPVTLALQVDAQTTTSDSLILHWRAKSWADRKDNLASLKHYEIYASQNSTNGVDGEWDFIQEGFSEYKDNLAFFPNTHPKWVRVVELDADTLKLGRLEVFQSAPEGQKNDIWMFFGDSETLSCMGAGDTNYQAETRFGNQIHENNPCYYPMVLNMGRGGERAVNAYLELESILDDIPGVNVVAYCYGINDAIFSVPQLLPYDNPLNDSQTAVFVYAYTEIMNICNDRGVFSIPSRIPWVHFPNDYTGYTDTTADKTNGLTPLNLYEIDSVIAEYAPYAMDTTLGVPYADFDTWYREHRDEGDVFQEDLVHFYRRGINQFNKIWVHTAEQVVYKNSSCDTTGQVSISCPANMYLTLDSANATILSTWDSPLATTSCGLGESVLLTQVEGEPMGSTIGVGNYYIGYQVADNCGQSAECRFSITVSPPPVVFDCDSIEGFTKIGELENHGYYLSENVANWKNARDTANAIGGYLAAISSQAENDLLHSALHQEVAFIGLYDYLEEGKPEWSNGESLVFDLGFDNSDENDFALMNFWSGTWGYSNTWITKKYILEIGCEVLDLTVDCPDDLTIQLPVGQLDTAFVWDEPAGTTTCELDDEVFFTQVNGAPNGALLSMGSYEYLWAATDSCGNTSSCVRVITVDSTPIAGDLSLTCSSGIDIVLPPGQLDTMLIWDDPVATTSCNVNDEVMLTQISGPQSGTVFGVGESLVSYVATDNCSNVDTCTTVIVVDSVAGELVMLCPVAVSIVLPIGQLDTMLMWTDPVVTTSCNVNAEVMLSQISGPESGATFLVGESLVAYVATDNCGHTDTCSFTITVEEMPILSLICPEDIKVELPIEQLDTLLIWAAPVPTTTCKQADGVFVEQLSGVVSGSVVGVGDWKVVYEARDSCENEEACQFSIIVTQQPDATETLWTRKLIVEPNPVRDVLTIRLVPSGNVDVKIYSFEGILEAENVLETLQGQINVNVDGLQSGVYLLHLTGSELNSWARFVKM